MYLGDRSGFHSGHVWEPQLYQATVANGENADRLYLLHKHQLSWVAYETTHNHAPISTFWTSLLGATDDLIEVCGISNYNPQLEIWFTTFYTLITDFQIAGLILPPFCW